MYLGLTLNKLDDFNNCCLAMDKALELDKNDKDYLIYLNYCVVLIKDGQSESIQKAR